MTRVGRAAKAEGRAFMTFAPNAEAAPALHALGVTCFFVASEHAFLLDGARRTAKALRAL
jgi:2-keto-3-deoxy-L-rhamnonate aldolase RhmA